MKKRVLAVILSVFLILSAAPAAALAADTAPANGYNDHDEAAIKNFLNQNSVFAGQTNAAALGYTANDPSTWSGVTWTDPGDGELHVQRIDFSNKALAGSLDLSNCAALESLNCGVNALTALDVSGCAALQVLGCECNLLTALDVSGCTSIRQLLCNATQLTTLNISECTALEFLDFSLTPLTAVDMSKCTKLRQLLCNDNQLTALDVSGLSSLELISCVNNRALGSLDISSNTALRNLFCSGCALTALDTSACPDLSFLDCNNNALIALDTTANTKMEYLWCLNNPMTQVNAYIGGQSVKAVSSGNGYIGLYRGYTDYYVQAYPVGAAMFYNWTEGGSVVSADTTFSLDRNRDYDLTANYTSQAKTAYLAGINLSAGSLSRTFAKKTYSYKVYLPEDQESVTLTPVREYDGAAMTINGQPVSSYTVSVDNGKSKTVKVKVTYGKSSKVYTFVVTRAKSTNNDLASLTASAGTFNIPFDPAVTNYTLSLDEGTKSVKITDTVASPYAKAAFKSKTYRLGSGDTKVVKLTVKAQSGVKKTYTITITRAK